jgi:hypothetical protein
MKHLATPPGTGWAETEGASKPELGNVHHLNRRQAGCDPPKCLKSLIFRKFHPGLASREQLTGNPVSQALRYAGRASKRLPTIRPELWPPKCRHPRQICLITCGSLKTRPFRADRGFNEILLRFGGVVPGLCAVRHQQPASGNEPACSPPATRMAMHDSRTRPL